MMKVIIRVKDKTRADDLKKYGSLVYTSPILNIVGLEINKDVLNVLSKDANVISVEISEKGHLLLA